MSDHSWEAVPILYIERKPDSAKYRVIGKGVTVEFLSTFIDDPDWTVESICEGYDLTPAELHAAWSFYYDHKDEIDRRVTEETAITPLQIREAAEKRQKILRRR